MSEQDDDKPTIIIDFKALQAQQAKDDEILIEDAVQTELSSDELFDNSASTDTNVVKKEVLTSRNIYVFDFKSDFFKTHFKIKNEKIKRLTELSQLNQALEKDPKSIIVFYYNSNPKVVNQLCLQIRTKFTKTNTLIIAKNLSSDKAVKHSKTQFKADDYLSYPFKETQFNKCLEKLS